MREWVVIHRWMLAAIARTSEAGSGSANSWLRVVASAWIARARPVGSCQWLRISR